jgi:hypothetical protein
MSHVARIECIVPKSLSAEARQHLTEELYAVHQHIFDGVERQAFARYVVESKAEHTWVYVHRGEQGEIVGYCALHVFERRLGEVPVAVFRAEAGLLPSYRGSNIIVPRALRGVLRYLSRNPGRKAFYLGSLVHPSSYVTLAKSFREVWPRHGRQTPAALHALMEELALEFGLEPVDPARPLLRRVGWRTRESQAERERWHRSERETARFFLQSNPGYGEGHGLVTLVPLHAGNLLGALGAVGRRTLRKPWEAVLGAVQRLPPVAWVRRRQAAPVAQLGGG